MHWEGGWLLLNDGHGILFGFLHNCIHEFPALSSPLIVECHLSSLYARNVLITAYVLIFVCNVFCIFLVVCLPVFEDLTPITDRWSFHLLL